VQKSKRTAINKIGILPLKSPIIVLSFYLSIYPPNAAFAGLCLVLVSTVADIFGACNIYGTLCLKNFSAGFLIFLGVFSFT
jgi:hypothetical protein